MKLEVVESSFTLVPSKSNHSFSWMHAFTIVSICWATTESTSMSIRLNSSKHAHAPAVLSPLKNLPIAL